MQCQTESIQVSVQQSHGEPTEHAEQAKQAGKDKTCLSSKDGEGKKKNKTKQHFRIDGA